MRAVTDSGPVEPNQTPPEPIANLFSLMKVVSEPDTLSHFQNAYADCSIRYGDLKKQLAEDIIKFTSPIRERILDIYKDDDYLRSVVKKGAESARENASATLREVRKIIGYKSF